MKAPNKPVISKLLLAVLAAGLNLMIDCGRSFAEARPDATVSDPPSEVAVDFENPLDLRLVKLEVLDDQGSDHAIGPPIISSDHKRLSVRVHDLSPGVFVVQWGVVDRAGKLSSGSYRFFLTRPDTLSWYRDFVERA